jgi:hypothetical protein
MALAQHQALRRLRLLDLDDQVAAGEHLGRGGEHLGASALVVPVEQALPRGCVLLNEHLMPVLDGLAHAGGRHADAILVNLDLLRHADAHG